MIETLPLRRIFVPHFCPVPPAHEGSTALLHRGESTRLRCDAQYEGSVTDVRIRAAGLEGINVSNQYLALRSLGAAPSVPERSLPQMGANSRRRSLRLPLLKHELQRDLPLIAMDVGPVRGPDTPGQGVGSVEQYSLEVLVTHSERQP